MPVSSGFDRIGGPDVPAMGRGRARLRRLPPASPVRHEAVGVNFIDTYHRSGLYPVPLPSGLGRCEAAGVEAVGEASPTAPATGSPGTRAGRWALSEARATSPPASW